MERVRRELGASRDEEPQGLEDILKRRHGAEELDGFMRLMSLEKGPDPVRAYDAATLMVYIADTPGIAAEPRTVTVEFLRLRIGG